MNKLKMWLLNATNTQKEDVAKAASSSVSSLRLAANGYRTEGDVDLSVDFAARIEEAIATHHDPLLPVVTRGDLCKTCAKCQYFLKCKK